MLQLLKNTSWHQTKYLFLFFCKHPLLMITAVFATYKTIRLMDKHYPNEHHKHNLANAVRHALWNMLLINYGKFIEKNQQKLLTFTKIITDWHEEFSPNKVLAKHMDLHNNQMGRTWMMQNMQLPSKELLRFLQEKAKDAFKFEAIQQLENCEQLVYLED